MEHRMFLTLLSILTATQCHVVALNETCVYNPCQNGGTCMNVLRPVDGKSVEYEGVFYLHVSSTPMTWAKAIEYCKEEGGGLVGFEDKVEETFGDNLDAKAFLDSVSTYWVSARYHGNSSEWKWYPLNETFDTSLGDGEDGDCMIYSKGMSINIPQNEPCNSNYSFICEGYNAWTSQCRCPPQYYGPFCEETDESGTYSKAKKTCEGERFEVTCAVEQKRIRIEYAAYGVHDNTTCNDGVNFLGGDQTCLARTSLQEAADECTGKSFCDFYITNSFFQSNPCTPQKHLDLRYQCVPNDPAIYNAPYTTAQTEAPTIYCKERVEGNTTYEVTPENTTIYPPCPQGYTGKMTFSCLEGGMWQDDGPDDSGCTKIREVEILDEQISEGTMKAVDIAESIENLLKDDSMKTELEDNEVVHLLSDLNQLQKKQLGESNETTKERIDTATSFAERTLRIGSVLLSSDEEEDSQESVSVNITEAMEDVAFIVAEELEEDTAKTVSTESIDMTCGSVPGGRNQSLSYPGDEIFKNTNVKNTRAVAIMPPSAFDDGPNTKSTLALLEYKKIDNIGNRIFQPEYTSDELINKSVVNTIVFGASASRGNTPVKTFAKGEEFTFILQHANTNLTGSVSCAFWDSTNKTETPSGSWSSNGCVVVKSNRTHTTCACNHLTNFAILLDVTGVYEDISDAHSKALELLSIIGCSVSIGCLAICVFAFSFFKSLWNTRTTIHRNLCISLLTAQLLFLVGVERTENEVVCSVIAAILHYTFLCSFAWMALEGIQLYIMLVHVFSTSSKVLPYYLAGYGLPAIVVAVAGGISKGEGYGHKQYCWLSTDRGFIWSFAGPVAFIILVNFVFLVVSIRIAYSGRAAVSKDATKSQNIKVWIKGAVTLTFLLGSTWSVGFFFLSGASIPMAYAFTILNSLQGMFIFIYHCLGNDRIKKELAKFLLRQPCLPDCLRVRLEAVARVGNSVYSITQSSTVMPNKKPDTVAQTEKKKDAVHPVVCIQDVDEHDSKPKSWLYNRYRAGETKMIPTSEYPEPDYY